MIVQKSYKFRFIPTPEQIIQLSKEFGCARWVWNRALIEKDYAYQQWVLANVRTNVLYL